MSKIGIAPHTLTKEGRDLQAAAKSKYEQVILIDPHKIWVAMEYDHAPTHRTIVHHDGEDITDIDALIVRGSRKYGSALSVLSQSLLMAGCNVIDPPSRYSAGYVSKLKSGIRRYRDITGSEIYYSFYLDGAVQMADHIRKNKRLPVVVKPIDGKRSRGKVVVKTSKRLKRIAGEFFENRKSDSFPFFVQPFEKILHEYRIILADGHVVAAVEKIKRNSRARGSQFVIPDDMSKIDRAVDFCQAHCSDWGVLGVDVAECERGHILIEENRAPQWRRVQEVVDKDIAKEIVSLTFVR